MGMGIVFEPGMDFTAGKHEPCAGCPWRKGNASRSCGIPEKHEASKDAFSGEDGIYTVMECHTLPADVHGACVGYMLSEHAINNIVVRIAYGEGIVGEIGDGGHAMHEKYEDMAAELYEYWGFV